MDAQKVMKEVKNIGRRALADFFNAMTAQKPCHWHPCLKIRFACTYSAS